MIPTHRPLPALLKVAAGNNMLEVGPRADRWIQEVSRRLLEEHPYLADYSLRGTLTGSNQEKLYGLGYIDLRTPATSPLQIPGIRVPFVIEKGMLYPLKVFLDSKGRADMLSRDIVGEILFQAAPATQLSPPEPTTSLMSALYPPDRVRHGMMGMGGSQYSKQSSVTVEGAAEIVSTDGPWLGDEAESMLKAAGVQLTRKEREQIHAKSLQKLAERGRKGVSILNKIAHTITSDQQDRFMREARELEPYFRHNQKIGMVNMLTKITPSDKRDAATRMKEASRGGASFFEGGNKVFQIERLGYGKYVMKTAEADVFEPKKDLMSVHDVSAALGEDLVADIRENGHTTVSTEAAIQQNLDSVKVDTISDYGIYKVQALDNGSHLVGWVITNVVDMYGGASNLKIFTNGEDYSCQESIAGVRVSQGTALPRKIPRGGDFGCFYVVSPSGAVTATLPMTITREEDIEGTLYWACVDLWGTPIRVTMAPDLRRPVEIGDDTFAIPDYMLFLPLKNDRKLVPEPLMFSKTASPDNVRLVYNGKFTFTGPAVEKVASQHRQALGEADAEFLGVALGLTRDACREKMAWAMHKGEVTLRGRTLVSSKEKQEKIAAITQQLAGSAGEPARQLSDALRQDTVKIAASLPEMALPHSVDTVLSLNFINHENLQLFIESLPHLETARRDLAELYITTMLGLPDVSRMAILRAMESLAEVSQGLKKIKMRAMLV